MDSVTGPQSPLWGDLIVLTMYAINIILYDCKRVSGNTGHPNGNRQ